MSCFGSAAAICLHAHALDVLQLVETSLAERIEIIAEFAQDVVGHVNGTLLSRAASHQQGNQLCIAHLLCAEVL